MRIGLRKKKKQGTGGGGGGGGGQGELPIEWINRRRGGRGTEKRGETIGTQGAVGEKRGGDGAERAGVWERQRGETGGVTTCLENRRSPPNWNATPSTLFSDGQNKTQSRPASQAGGWRGGGSNYSHRGGKDLPWTSAPLTSPLQPATTTSTSSATTGLPSFSLPFLSRLCYLHHCGEIWNRVILKTFLLNLKSQRAHTHMHRGGKWDWEAEKKQVHVWVVAGRSTLIHEDEEEKWPSAEGHPVCERWWQRISFQAFLFRCLFKDSFIFSLFFIVLLLNFKLFICFAVFYLWWVTADKTSWSNVIQHAARILRSSRIRSGRWSQWR